MLESFRHEKVKWYIKMVQKQKFFNRDPNGLGRGSGYYYARGGVRDGYYVLPSGKRIKGTYFSKYEESRDVNRKSQDWRIDNVGIPKNNFFKAYRHIGDGDLRKKKNR
jgi:hypothetical protein